MADDHEQWDRTQPSVSAREPFQAKASPVALHADANRRRNLDKEEAARDRMMFRWVALVVGVLVFFAVIFFVISRLGGAAE